MFKLKVKLKQYTPIIHFQWNQRGATLRATELKPKLDAFLLENVFRYKFEKFSDYLIGDKREYKTYSNFTKDEVKKEPSFDYKITIKSTNSEPIDIEKEVKTNLYFVNNMDNKSGGRKEKVKALFNQDKIEVNFFSFNKNLINCINENIASFFSVNNFGTRQNKGFGSFFIEDSDFLKELKKVRSNFLYIQYDYKNYQQIFNDIWSIYTLMKSGVNYPDNKNNNGKNKKTSDCSTKGLNASYHKSFLFEYMLKKNVGNEKRFIKENFFSPNLKVKSDGMCKKYVRGLLGVCSHVTFRGEMNGRIDYESDIHRFKSPLTFKIVNNTIAIIPEKIPCELFNKEFIFKHECNNKKVKLKKINTPSKDEFDLVRFLYAFADYFNNEFKIIDVNNPIEIKLKAAKKKIIKKVGEKNG